MTKRPIPKTPAEHRAEALRLIEHSFSPYGDENHMKRARHHAQAAKMIEEINGPETVAAPVTSVYGFAEGDVIYVPSNNVTYFRRADGWYFWHDLGPWKKAFIRDQDIDTAWLHEPRPEDTSTAIQTGEKLYTVLVRGGRVVNP